VLRTQLTAKKKEKEEKKLKEYNKKPEIRPAETIENKIRSRLQQMRKSKKPHVV